MGSKVDILTVIEVTIKDPKEANLFMGLFTKAINCCAGCIDYRYIISAHNSFERYAYIYNSAKVTPAVYCGHDSRPNEITKWTLGLREGSTKYDTGEHLGIKHFFPLVEYRDSRKGREPCFGVFKLCNGPFINVMSWHNRASGVKKWSSEYHLEQALKMFSDDEFCTMEIPISEQHHLHKFECFKTPCTILTGDFNVCAIEHNDSFAKFNDISVCKGGKTLLKPVDLSNTDESGDMLDKCLDYFLMRKHSEWRMKSVKVLDMKELFQYQGVQNDDSLREFLKSNLEILNFGFLVLKQRLLKRLEGLAYTEWDSEYKGDKRP